VDMITVIGAGLAGVSAAGQLRELGYDGRLVLVGAESRLPYDRPLLSKDLLLGTRNSGDIGLRPSTWYEDNDIELRLGERATHIAPADNEAVVLATGGIPRRLAVPGADHPAITTLRTVEGAEALRDRLVAGARVGVVGAGLIGAEVTAAAVARGCSVTLIDPVARPLERVVGTQIAARLHNEHRRRGVDLIEAGVSEVESQGPGARLRLSDGRYADCDVVVTGIGIEPDVSLAVAAGLPTDHGVLVDESQRTAHPRVYAAGDAARTAGLHRSEHWDAARQEGVAVAAALLGQRVVRRVPWFWSDRYGTRLEVVGEFTGESVVRGEPAGSFIAFTLRDGVVTGAVAIDRAAEMAAVRRLADRRVRVRPDQLADESVDLRELIRAPAKR
jgi:3-phenylpropionate/trans-cinnamate dioxygenase ferredoxin reductase subunit